jgi:endonuclease/exonuclease/phosphatase (EEP) superfamily protein YafD
MAIAALFTVATVAQESHQTNNRDCLQALAVVSQPPQADALDGQAIRILNWNIQKSSQAGWVEDLNRLATGADLVMLQEAILEAELRDKLEGNYHVVFAPGYFSEDYRSGVFTASRVPPQAHCTLSHQEPWLGTPKATNITEYPLAGTNHRLLVINLHMVNFTLGMEDFAAQIEALSPLLLAHEGPLLVAGDFNTWSESRRAHVEAFMAEHQLSAVKFTPDHRTTIWSMPLDHLYLRGLRPLEAKTIAVETSDHNPLLVTLEVSE